MQRVLLWSLLLLLAVLLGAGPGWAQPSLRPPGARPDELRYRTIYGPPPQPPATDKAPGATEDKETTGSETTTTETPRPRYRFDNDPLLNPPGRRAPAVPPPAPAAPGRSVSPAYPQDPARPPGTGYTSEFPPGLASPGPPSVLPRREIKVQVTDDQGLPIPQAQVSLSTRQYVFLAEGLTNEQGVFMALVPCYLPGREPMLAHTLRVSTPFGSLERLVITRQGSCRTTGLVEVMLANPNRLQEMLRRYKERQAAEELDEEEQKAKEDKEQELLPGQAKGKEPGKPKTPGKAAPGAKK